MEINSKKYWDERFRSGDWKSVGGSEQTRSFAEKQVRFFKLPRSFGGTILDFGCGLGDAMPVYRARYPKATLIGMDFSDEAITKCRAKFGALAEFRVGDHREVPPVDVIVASNVIEHLPDDEEVVRILLSRCAVLYVIVPYLELNRIPEHVHTYSRHSFKDIGPVRTRIIAVRGWSQYGLRMRWIEIYLKNLLRPLFGRKIVRRRRQILFQFSNHQHVVQS